MLFIFFNVYIRYLENNVSQLFSKSYKYLSYIKFNIIYILHH